MDGKPTGGKSRQESSGQRNEGEGNKTAARQYNEAQREFVRSGKVDEQAHSAEQALDSAERSELEKAELVGKRHVAEEDPAVKKR
jgi:hypothetical protein